MRDLQSLIDGVGGWFGPREATELYRSACDQLSSVGDLVVELGSWKGRSTIALARAAADVGTGRVMAIDPHVGAATSSVTDEVDTLTELTSNLDARGLLPLVDIVRGFSHETRHHVADDSVSLLFHDASHWYEDVVRDLAMWESALRPGAVLAVNDPGRYGVNRAIRDYVFRRGGPYRLRTLVENTVFLEYDGRPASVADRIRAFATLWAIRRKAQLGGTLRRVFGRSRTG